MTKTIYTFISCILCTCVSAQNFTEVSGNFGIYVLHESSVWGNGASFYDFNHDGWDDLTTADGSNFIKLFENDGTGNLAPSEHIINFTFSGQIIGVLWFDYDNDDDEDLLVSQTGGRILLFKNDGAFNFTEVGISSGLDPAALNYYGIAAADCDYDGDLDFSVAKYYNPQTNNNQSFVSSFYRNNGNGTFSEVSNAIGLGVGAMPNFMPVFFDINQDNYVDLLYVVDRYQHPNKVLINDGTGNFTDQTTAYGLGVGFDAMSGTVGDYDNDGDFDVFMSNTVPGNFFFQNNNGTYNNIAASAGVETFQVCWGSNWIDYDNNGLQDLFVGATNSGFNGAPNFWYVNNGDDTFTSTPSIFGPSLDMNPTFCNVIGDVNNDGYYDYYNNNNDPAPSRFWRNNGGDNNYLSMSFKGTVSNKNAFGTTIHAYADGIIHSRYTHGGESYIAQNSGKEIIGLADIEIVDSIVIRWPLGLIEKYYNIPANQHIQFIEGASFQNAFMIGYSDISICPGQSATLDAGEGLSWTWNNGHTERFLVVNEPGEYSVTVNHGFGFNSSSEIIIVEEQAPPMPFLNSEEPTCFGFNDGSVYAVYDYPEPVTTIWNGNIFGDTLSNLAAGTYSYTSISSNGCISQGEVVLEEPSEINFTYYFHDVSCHGGADGSFGIIKVIGGTGLISVDIDGESFSNLTAGSYLVTFTDALGCSVSTSFEITEPSPLEAFISVVSEQIQGANGATWNAVGGEAPYTLLVNAIPLELNTFNTLPSGDYEWILTDANGCAQSGVFTIQEQVEVNVHEFLNETYSYNQMTNELIFPQLYHVRIYATDGRLIDYKENTHKIQMPSEPGIWMIHFGNQVVRLVTR